MTTAELLSRVLQNPSPEDLRLLQAALLAAEREPVRREEARRALELAGELHSFLCEMASKLSARAHSHVASLMDIGAVGAVAVENLADPVRRTPVQIGLAALGEGLMVLASRQYVRAWEREMRPLATRAAWIARQELWRMALESPRGRPPDESLSGIDALLAPAMSDDTPTEARLALAGRLLQVLVVFRSARALAVESEPGA